MISESPETVYVGIFNKRCSIIQGPFPIEVQSTPIFQEWLNGLRDKRAVNRIIAAIDRAKMGNLGDTRRLGDGVSEMRIHYGPGYRLYFTRRGRAIIILLCGGDKDDQQQDIGRAQRLAREWR